jgi:5'-3' exonuclease
MEFTEVKNSIFLKIEARMIKIIRDTIKYINEYESKYGPSICAYAFLKIYKNEIDEMVRAIINDENESQEKRIGTKIKHFNSFPIYNRKKEKYINPFKHGWQNRYYKSLFTNEYVSFYDKRNIAINYIEGLEWTLRYYTTGEIDWKWKYKYNYPPLLQDLFKCIPDKPTTFINNINICDMREITQLCYVLPKQSLHLLPPVLAQILLNEFSEWYIDTTMEQFEWSFCRYFWETHLITSELDIDKFIETINKNIIL